MIGTPPQLLPGDWITITQSSGLLDIGGCLAEITTVINSESLAVIVNGHLAIGLDWPLGDRWERAAAPDKIPTSWMRSLAAPSAGLASAHSWRDRPAPSNPQVLAHTDFWGWIEIAGGDDMLLELIEAITQALFDTDELENWPDYTCQLDPASVSDTQIERVTGLARLLAEADCMNDGFILHNYARQLELRMPRVRDGIVLSAGDQASIAEKTAETTRGLEAIIDGYAALGAQVIFGEAD